MTVSINEDDPADPVDVILDRLLDLPGSIARSELERECAQSPLLAERLRARWRTLESLGLLEPDDSGASGLAVPERLGPFRLLERLGGGGMGVVYRARQDGLERDVAIKVVRPEMAFFDQSKARFRREAEAVAQLAHPGIVPVHAFGEAQGVSYLAMELVDGITLDVVVTRLLQLQPVNRTAHAIAAILGCDEVRIGKSRIECAVRLASMIAEALAHAHGRGVVHRDVKPSNVMVDRDGQARLLDFGLAMREGAAKLTRTGTQIGSLQYSSPEQIRGVDVAERTDVYSLGALLYELVTLRPAFAGATTQELTHAILTRDPPRMMRVAPDTPADLEAIVLRALEKDPARRYDSMQSFAADLRAFLEYRPVQARRLTPAHRLLRWARREPLRAALAVVLALGVPALLGEGIYIAATQVYTAAGRRSELRAKVDGLIGDGFLHLANDAYADAELAFHAAMELDADDFEAQLGLRLAQSRGNVALQPISDAERAAIDTSSPTSAEDLFSLAMRSVYAGGRRDDPAALQFALVLLERARDREGSARATVLRQFAEIAGWAGDAARADRAAMALQRLWPDDALAWYASGRAWLSIDPARAIPCFERARSLRPDLPHVVGNLALALRGAGRMDEALAAFRTAIGLDPKAATVHVNYGAMLLSFGDHERARRELETAVALEPRFPGAHYNLGLARAALGDPKGARACFEETVGLAPAYAEAWNNLGALQLQDGDGQAAVQSFTKFTTLRGDDALGWKNLALAHWQLEQWEPAIAALKRATGLAEDDKDTHDQLVQLLEHTGDREGLRAELDRFERVAQRR